MSDVWNKARNRCIETPNKVWLYDGNYKMESSYKQGGKQMTQEEKLLLIFDISTRIPYGVKAEVSGWDEENEKEVLVPVTVYSVNKDGYVYFCDNEYDITYCRIDGCRPYLRSMLSSTEEEKCEYCDLQDKFLYSSQYPVTNAGELFDWLTAHHFDFRNLIEKGLALEAPEGMYKND